MQGGKTTPLELLRRDDPACLDEGVANWPLLPRMKGYTVDRPITQAGLLTSTVDTGYTGIVVSNMDKENAWKW